MLMLTFSDPQEFNQLKVGPWQPWPNSMLNSLLLKSLHEYLHTLSLKLAQFCFWGNIALGKIPQQSPYLL